jgi:ACS family hexuronate transporter-like MFS transporter
MAKAFKVKGLRWWIVILLMGITTINYLDRTTLSVSVPVLKKKLGMDEIDFSYILMAFQFAYLVMQPLVGRIIDWLGLRLGFAISIITWSIAQMFTGFATGWRSFAVFRSMLGIAEAGNFPGGIKAVGQWFRPKERTIATGIFNVGAGLGAAIAPPVVVWLILHYSWQFAFVATGAFSLLWAILWVLLYKSPEKHPWITKEELSYISEGERELGVAEPPEKTGVWKIILPQRNFWAVGIARFFSEPAWQFFSYWIPLYLATERNFNLKQIGYSAWVPFIAADIGSLFGGMLSPFFINKIKLSVMTARKCSATVAALLMIFAVFVGRAPSAGWAIFFICIGAFAHQAMSATLMTLPADLFPKRTVATANGLSGTMAIGAGMLFTAVIGRVAKHIGYGPLFTTIAFLDIIGVTFLWSLLREPKQMIRGRKIEESKALPV